MKDRPDGNPAVVHAPTGSVLGVRVGGVRRFLGIPYAVGGRFRAPTAAPAWPGVRPALAHGPACPQVGPTAGPVGGSERAGRVERLLGIRSHEPLQDERCLVLNVWAPDVGHETPVPVLVWLHGHVATGSAADPWVDGAALAHHNLVVSVNHRLSVFGHAHDGRADGRGATNAALLDIVEALRWVRTNIRAFGGDPDNVTLGGSSAGAFRAACIAASPRAAGLLHRVALHSPLAYRALTLEEATQRTAQLARAVGLPLDLDRLREVDAVSTARAVDRERLRFLPVVDGDVLPADPLELIDRWRHLPLLIGTTRDEGFTFVPDERATANWSRDTVRGRAGAVLGPRGVRLVDDYRALHPDLSPRDLEMEVVAGLLFRRGCFAITERRTRLTPATATFVYEFGGEMPLVDPRPRSPHGFDIPFAFGNLRLIAGARSVARNRALERDMTTLWRAFAAGRQPMSTDGTVWEPHTGDHLETLLLGPQSTRLVRGYRVDERRIVADVDIGAMLGRRAWGT